MTNSAVEDVAAIKKLLSETYGNLVMAHNAAGYADMYSDDVLTSRAGGDPNTIKFRIFWLLRKEAAGWKIFRQIWNKKPVG